MVVAEGVEKAEHLASLRQLDPDTAMWKVTGESVLELGAGLSFPGFTSSQPWMYRTDLILQVPHYHP